MSTVENNKNGYAATEALWRVAETDDIQRLESIVSQGADVNASNASGMTALMHAASRGRIRMVRALLAHGADPNASRNDKFTPLMLAAFFGHEEVVRVLVEYGASRTAATRFGTSAQIWAAARTFQDVAHYLKKPDPVNKLRKERAVEHKGTHTPIEARDVSSSLNLRGQGLAIEPSVEQDDRIHGAWSTTVECPSKSSNKRMEGEATVEPLAQQLEVVANIQPAKRRTTAYALATLLFVIAVIGGWALRRERHRLQLNSQTHSNVAGVVVTPANAGKNWTVATMSRPASQVQFTTIEERNGYDVNSGVDHLPTKQPSVTRVIITLPEVVSPAPSHPRKNPGTQNRVASTDEPNPMAPALAQNGKIPVDHTKDVRSRKLPPMTTSLTNSQPSITSATTSPMVPQAPISRATPKNAPAPTTTQLISSPANSPSKGRAIQWP